MEEDDISNNVANIIRDIYKKNVDTNDVIIEVMRDIFTELYKTNEIPYPIILEDEMKINSRIVFKFLNSDMVVIGDTYVIVYDKDTQKQNYVHSRNDESLDSFACSALGMVRIVVNRMHSTGESIKSANKK